MKFASLSPSAIRAVSRIVLAVVVTATIVLTGLQFVRPSHTAAADPMYACYNRSTYALRYVGATPTCTRLENDVLLNDNAHPVWVCVKPSTGALVYAGSGQDPVYTRCAGAPPSKFLRVPGDNDTPLCLNNSTGALTLPPCGAGQTPIVVPKRNTPPVADAKTATVLEDAAGVPITLSASDADGQALTFAISQQPAHGSLSATTGTSCTGTIPKNCTASVTYTPTANYFGPDSFKYRANDGLADSNLATVSVTVTGVNDEPSFAAGGGVTVNEDSGAYNQPWATGVSAGPGEGSQTLTFHVSNDNTSLFSAQPAISAAGALAFTPAANANGSATVSVYLTDDGGVANGGDDTSPTQTFTLTVTAVNDPPTFTLGGNQTVGEDAGAQTVANFATGFDAGPPDEDGTQTLDHYIVTNDNHALFSVQPDISNAGTLTYTPAPDATGVATVGVKAKDTGGTANGGDDTSAAQTFTITVTAVDDAPVNTVPGTTQTTLEDTDLVFSSANSNLISVADVDAGSQDVQVTLTVTHGKITLDSTNGLTFTTGNGAHDPTMTFTGTLSAVNAALSGMTFEPAADYNGSASLTITTDDLGHTGAGGPKSDTDTVNLSITAVNDPPSFTSAGGVTVLEDSGPASSTWATAVSTGPADESGQTPTFHLANNSNPALFSSGPNLAADGTLTFTPAANKNGVATLDVTLTDGGGTANGGSDTSTTHQLTITVTAVNDEPSFTAGATVTVNEDSGAYGAAWATALSTGPSDESGQALNFVLTNTSNPGLFSAGPSISATGVLSFTPAANAFGTATVDVAIHDDGGTANGGDDTSPTQVLTVTVNSVNDAPSFTKGGNQTAGEDTGPQTVDPWATGLSTGPANESAQTLTFVVTTNTNTALFSAGPAISSTGVLTYTPAADKNGTATITLKLTDDGGTANGGVDESPTQTFTITVTPVNDAPSFTSGGDVAIPPGTTTYSAPWAAAISPGPADEAGQTVHFEITGNTNPAIFTGGGQPAVSATGVLSFTASGTQGNTTITLVLTDDGGTANGGADTSTPVTFVISTNRPPTISDVTNQTINEDANTGALAVTVGDPDEGPNALVLTASSDNTTLLPPGTAYAIGGSGANRTVTITPAANENGSATVTLTVTDSGSLTATDTFTLTVTAVNDEPSFGLGTTQTVNEDAGARTVNGFASTISKGPANESGQVLTFHVSNDNNPLFSAQPAINETTGTLTYTPAANAFGSATVSVFLTDDGGNIAPNDNTSPTQTFTITVNAVNDAPSFTAGGAVTVLEDGAPYNAAWATGIGKGPSNESGQTVNFVLANNSNPGLFGTGPAIAAGGTLTFTLTANANGSATIDVAIHDDGGTANGGVDTSATQQLSITVTAVNDRPTFTASNPPAVNEDAGAQTVTGWATGFSPGPADESGQTNLGYSVANVSNPALFAAGPAVATNGTLTYTPAANANGSSTFDVTVQDSGGTANGGQDTSVVHTITIAVTAVNDAPVNTVPGAQTTTEDTAKVFTTANSNLVSIADVDAGSSAVQVTLTAANGTVTLSGIANLSFTAGDGTADATMTFTGTVANVNAALNGLAFTPAANFNDGRGAASLTILTNDQGNTGLDPSTVAQPATDGPGAEQDSDTVAISVTAVNDPPTVTDQGFTAETNMKIAIAAPGLLTNAADPDTGDPGYTFAPVVDTATISATSPAGGTISNVNAATGAFDFDPPPGVTGAVTFTYKICDTGNPGPAQCSTVHTVTVTVSGPVIWFVNPNAATNGVGTLASPFQSLTGVSGANNDADDVDAANHRIFVYTGTTAGGITLNSGEWLIGQGVSGTSFDTVMGISPPTGTIARPGVAGTKPAVGNASGTAVLVTAGTGIQIKGLSLSGSTNAIDVTATTGAGVTIADNAITSAGSEGIDVNANGGTVTVDVQTTTITSTGNAFDARSTAGTLGIVFSNNTSLTSNATAVFIDGSGGGTTTVTGFANNTVAGATGGTGISVNAATFDSSASAGIQQVAGGTTVVGATGAGNGVGGSGVVLTSVQGNLLFTDLDVFADNGTGLRASGTGGGFTLGVGVGVAVIEATNGPALDLTTVAADLQLSSLKSTTSTTTGVSLTGVTGTVSAGSGSAITNAAGTDVAISSGSANVTYNGTITDDQGALVSISSETGGTKSFTGAITDNDDGDGSGVSLTTNTGATIKFTGGLVLSTGANAAFTATGGGTVVVTGSTNKITTTTGTALKVQNTTIGDLGSGVKGLTFQTITAGTSSDSAGTGIFLDHTGAAAGLTVSGGTIQHKTGANGTTDGIGIYLNNTSSVSLSNMQLNDFQNFGIRGISVDGFTLASSTVNSSGKNGNDDPSNEASVAFGTDDTSTNGLTGTASITNSVIEDGFENNFNIFNHSGSLTLTVTGSTIRDTSTVSPGAIGLQLKADGTASIDATITTTNFTRNRARGIQAINQGSGTLNVDIGTSGVANSGGTYADNGIAIDIDQNGAGLTQFNILNGTFTTANYVSTFAAGGAGSPINIFRGADVGTVARGLFQGTIAGNTINNSDSGTGPGMNIKMTGCAAGSNNTMTIKVDNNNVSHVGNYGIYVSNGDGDGTLNVNVTNNTVSTTTNAALEAIRVDAGLTSTNVCGASDSGTINANITGNHATADPLGGTSDIRVRQRFNSTFRLQGYNIPPNSATNDSQVQTFLAGLNTNAANTGPASVSADHNTTGFQFIADVPDPTN